MPATYPLPAFTDAEALDCVLSGCGSSFFVTVQPDGGCSFTFRFSTLPPSKLAAATATLIQHRFANEERFRDDLLAWLAANGRLFRRAAEPAPEQPLDANWTALGDAAGGVVTKLVSPALASNR